MEFFARLKESVYAKLGSLKNKNEAALLIFSLVFGLVYTVAVYLLGCRRLGVCMYVFFGGAALCFVLLNFAHLGVTVFGILAPVDRNICPSSGWGKIYWILAGVLALSYTLCLLTYFPGVGMNDGLNILNDWRSSVRQFSPVYCTYVHLLRLFGDAVGSLNVSIALNSVVQVVILSLLSAWIGIWLLKKGLPKWVNLIMLLYYIFSPLLCMYAITMLCDTVFSLLLTVVTIFIYELLQPDSEAGQEKHFWIPLTLCGIGMVWLHKAGAFILIPLFITMAFLVKPHWKKFLTMCAVVAAAVLLNKGIQLGLHTNSLFQETVSLPIQQLAATVSCDGDISDEDKEFLNQLMPLDQIKERYDPSHADPIRWADSFDREFLNANREKFMLVWLWTFPFNFGTYSRAYLDGTFWFWAPVQRHTVQYFSTIENTGGNEWLDNFMQENGIYDQPLIPEPANALLRNYYGLAKNYPREGICFWIILASLLLLELKKPDKRWIVVYMPVLLLWVSVMLTTPESESFRSVLSYAYLLPVFFGMLLWERTESKQFRSPHSDIK